MDFSVVAVAREDDSPVEEPLRVAVVADRLGYREVWAGEGPTWDSFVLAAAIGRDTEREALTAGPVAVSVHPDSLAQVLRSIAGYLTVPGYSDMFEAAGFGEAVELARTGADSGTLVRALPAAAAGTVGLVGDLDAVRARAEEYAEAGLDEIALVPATAGDPGGERTLTALVRA
ncbi:LLM class flavin-dependent oxidoreductase [Streptomyces sp. HD]|uniref:LLM class flavin-dependent oxidoreductase n=1 Tax=Streptomyces sp. HD TaxID=3020892 RepID=UPI002330A0E5|nr:LLM class flavin-dependent oxidoreductase [Streptomyces sp. HD]MDC0768787.1 LLM class flavin-dependent oxidoreductase [Streptomyces sp. HD]